MDLKLGRSPFEIRADDRDYSGLSISDRFLSDANIERSFFNGVNLNSCAFQNVKLNNTEFSEASIKNSFFQVCDLSGSDFVDSLFENVIFDNCTFEKGEWREASFRNCRFVKCNFDHTTVTLCAFYSCRLDVKTIDTAEHRAMYFNVFTRCEFERSFTERHFSSRNFGTPAAPDQNTLIPSGAETTIEQMCLLNNVGKLRVVDVAAVAEGLCVALAKGVQRRTSTLTFFSKIVRVLTDERRISPTSLVYLEFVVSRLASAVDDQDLFTAAMGAIVEIRSAAFSVATQATKQSPDHAEQPVTHITIHFSERYTRAQADVLRETLAAVAGIPDALTTDSVKDGSTIIDIVSNHIVEFGALLIAINFVLRQARTTIKLTTKIGKLIKNALKNARAHKPQRRSPRKPSKLPAVLKTGAVVPSLAPVRAAVQRHGRVLVEMDEPASVVVTVLVQHRYRRRK